MDKLTEASIIQQQYKHGLDYQNQMGFTTKWPEYERFKAGDQWPAPTELTKNLPRPVFNIIDYIENHKIASVMNENIKMLFTAQELPTDETADPLLQKAVEGAEKYTKMSDYVWEDIQQDRLNEEMLESASNLGTGVLHYYWDNSYTGGITQKWVGKLCGESIDPINIFFGNPQCREVQKQPWIIISKREMVETVRERAKKNGARADEIALIQGDSDTREEGYDAAQYEVKDGEKCTVLIRYRKKNGVIYWCEVCNNVTVTPEKPMTVVDEMGVERSVRLYPIAVMNWKPRKKCIFGIGDTEGLIPNQKGINFLLAMALLSAQQTAWPKIIVKFDALKQVIKNEPGEILRDVSNQPGDNIKFTQPGHFDAAVFALVDKFVDLTKQLSAAQDAATGDMDTGNLNATAIMLLQKASGVPIESIKKRFYRAMEDVGRIWMEFFRVYYNLPRMVTFKDEDGNEYTDTFVGSEYSDVDMSLKIDIGPSSSYSEALMMQSLDRFLDNQYITFEDYLEFAPKNVIPFKDRLKRKIEERMQMQAQEQMISDQIMNSVVQSMTPEQMEMVRSDPQLQDEIIRMLESRVSSRVENMEVRLGGGANA